MTAESEPRAKGLNSQIAAAPIVRESRSAVTVLRLLHDSTKEPHVLRLLADFGMPAGSPPKFRLILFPFF